MSVQWPELAAASEGTGWPPPVHQGLGASWNLVTGWPPPVQQGSGASWNLGSGGYAGVELTGERVRSGLESWLVDDKRTLSAKIDEWIQMESIRPDAEQKQAERWLSQNARFMDAKALETFHSLDPRGKKRVVDNVTTLANSWDPSAYMFSWAKDPDGEQAWKKRKTGSYFSVSSLPDAGGRPPPKVSCATVPLESVLCTKGFPCQATCMIYAMEQVEVFASATPILQACFPSLELSDAIIIEHDINFTKNPEIAQAVAIANGGVQAPYSICIAPGLAKWAAGIGSGGRDRDAAAKLALALSIAFTDKDIAQKLCQSFHPFGMIWRQLVQGTSLDEEHVQTLLENTPQLHLLNLQPKDSLVKQGLGEQGYAIPYNKNLKDLFSSASQIMQQLVDPKAINLIDDADWTTVPAVGAACKQAGLSDEAYAVATCNAKRCWAVGLGNNSKTRQSAAKLALALVIAKKDRRLVDLCDWYEEVFTFCTQTGLITSQEAEIVDKRRTARNKPGS